MISAVRSQPFFNLTTPGRVPFVANPANPAALTASSALAWIPASAFLGSEDGRYGFSIGFSGKTGMSADYTNNFWVAPGALEFSAGGLTRMAWDSNGIAFYNGWSPRFAGSSGQTLLRHLSGAWLVGNDTNQSNGALQLATHTTAAGGVGFFDLSLYRSGANRLATNATNFDCVNANVSGVCTATQLVSTNSVSVQTGLNVQGVQVVGGCAGGWGLPTGIKTRAAFDPSTVSLVDLAERVAALINDLRHTSSPTGHGLIGA